MPSLVQGKTKKQSSQDVVAAATGLGKSTRPFHISDGGGHVSHTISREAEVSLGGYKNDPGQPVQMTRKKKNVAKAASVLGGLALAGGIALGSVPLGIIGGLGLLGGVGYLAYKHFTKPSADERIGHWKSRGEARKTRGRFETGRYDTSTGPVTVSGLNRQRITQGRREDYSGESFGGMPPYSKIKPDLKPESVRALYDSSPDLPEMDEKQRLATSLATTLTNVSEADKAPGIDKLIRAQARRRNSDPTAPHPLDPSVNPAVSTAAKARQVMSGQIPLTTDQRRGIDEYASDSSDEEEESYVRRTGLLKKRV